MKWLCDDKMSDPSAEDDSVDTFISDSTKRSLSWILYGLMLFAFLMF